MGHSCTQHWAGAHAAIMTFTSTDVVKLSIVTFLMSLCTYALKDYKVFMTCTIQMLSWLIYVDRIETGYKRERAF